MLSRLGIRDIVLVERLELDFAPGLTVLTGETGAGKSILLDALGLALGARADSALVREGAERAEAIAEIELPAGHPALAMLAREEIEVEPGEALILQRRLKADGGSSAKVAGQSVPARIARALGETMVEIHGQHADRGLLDAKAHRGLLDAFGQVDTREVEGAWSRLSALRRERDELAAKAEAAAADREWLDHAIEELDALAPQPGEEEELAGLRQQMKDAARIEDDLSAIDPLLNGGEGALSQMRQAARAFGRVHEVHEGLASALAAIDRAIIEADEAERLFAEARAELVHDPRVLDEAEERLFALRGAARKHRVDVEGLAKLRDELHERRSAIETGSERLKALEGEILAAEAVYDAAADALSGAREAAAARLDARVAEELAPLKLGDARFVTELTPSEPGPHGIDRVEFTISTNPGSPFGPLGKIASGGELSRFLLAIRVALAEVGGAGTIIFDEIDRGVGGAVASAIGDRLARLAQQHQVLVVTHSPQVAARGQHHLRIAKASEGTVTRTSVELLGPHERREEIARMLSGAAVTDEARAAAAKLMEAA
ncbi:DNA repair protein RecN [Sphingomicrobium astaxanthinifaciens]|uniref:DNA repair protein RecN n=1 Tax=Sphingomicrobium astaxanthinifaciens TaxID=1227949 RepID=UPI001FCC73AA|nr:DNA repair protein RecN [Sphingomicrobium astaxanthinifaciens]MCJ7421497.1 DNA repair protein RecN [Sphingomicrobium astaxanthinifaciens]